MTLPLLDDNNNAAPVLPTPLPAPDAEAPTVLRWVKEHFGHGLPEGRVVATMSFNMEDCVLVDLLDKADLVVPVIYLDTHFLHAESFELLGRLQDRYPRFTFENRGTSLTAEEQARAYGPQLWRSDPNACCDLRKVQPMRAMLAEADVWLTGLTRDQGATRAHLPTVEADRVFGVAKVNPIVTWNRRLVWDYVQANNVPFNTLHEQSYPTIGCTHCTRPVEGMKPWEYSRAGRWTGQGKTECGLHKA